MLNDRAFEIRNNINNLEAEIQRLSHEINSIRREIEESYTEINNIKKSGDSFERLASILNTKNDRFAELSNLRCVQSMVKKGRERIQDTSYNSGMVHIEDAISKINRDIRKKDSDCQYYEGRIVELRRKIEMLKTELLSIENEGM